MNHERSWRKGLVILILCATAVAASAAWRSTVPAQSPAPAVPTGVAIINLKTLFDGLTEFKDGMALIEEKKKESLARIKDVEARLKKATDDLDALKDPPMSVRIDQQAIIAELQALGEARAAVQSRVLSVQAGDLMRRVYLNAVESAKKLAQQDGWDIILVDDRHISPPERVPGEGTKEGRRVTVDEVQNIIQQRQILIATERVDVTPALIALMNNEYKGKK